MKYNMFIKTIIINENKRKRKQKIIKIYAVQPSDKPTFTGITHLQSTINDVTWFSLQYKQNVIKDYL